jgi:hypothetical protein
MATTRYLYIDDEDSQGLRSYVRAVKANSVLIDIDIERPDEFEKQIKHLEQIISNYDGLILDLRLDQVPTTSGKTVTFRAPALAQEIRTRGADEEISIKEIPIVLWSTKEKLEKYYYPDEASHDLFDQRYAKETVVDEAERIQRELISLAEGYRTITRHTLHNSDNLMMLGLNRETDDWLDPRLNGRLANNQHKSIRSYARFILRDLIMRPGPLISEELLAARLGVDKQASLDWPTLRDEVLADYKYRGVFHDGWPRWWSYLIERKWWRIKGRNRQALSAMSAKQRIAFLKEDTGLSHLVAAQPIEPHYNDRYYTICEYFQTPLDPIDGVVIEENEPQPWQERRYLSLKAALNRLGREKPHSTEYKRLSQLKKAINNNVEEET